MNAKRYNAAVIIVSLFSISLASANAQAPTSNRQFEIYAVRVIKSDGETPYRGVLLGGGHVLTASHVVGWNPRVVIGGVELPAKIVKVGSLQDLDLALLSVQEDRVPVSVRLRRNPICRELAPIGTDVVIVAPDESTSTRIMSPAYIPPQYRARFYSLTELMAGWSGAGVFHPAKHCLLGIMSRRILKVNGANRKPRVFGEPLDYAGYFVPAVQIHEFLRR